MGFFISDLILESILQWLINHPEFISNPTYIGGDSYSGIPVPIITQLISNGKGGKCVTSTKLKSNFIYLSHVSKEN